MRKKVEVFKFGEVILKLKILAKEKEKIRKKLAITARKLRFKAQKLALVAREKENVRRKLEIITKEKENARVAAANVLEDLSIEKIKAENLANDLKKFKLALDNASDQVIITDKAGIVIYANNAVEKITGYKLEEAIGKKAGMLWHSPMPEDYYKKFWDTIEKEKQTFNGEIQNRRKNGESYTAAISVSPVLDNQNNILFFVGLERDITKEKEIDKAKSEFISLASHQLKTPPTAIKLITERLLSGKMGKFTRDQLEYFSYIRSSNQRMIDIVNTLLSVSRIELGTFALNPISKDIGILLLDILDGLKLSINNKKIHLEKMFSKKGIEAPVDEQMFRIIINNLIINAINYTEEGGTISVDCKKIVKGKKFGGKILQEDSFVIAVADDGCGIPENQQDKLFIKFFRADNAKERHADGTGLGLYIVKSILDNSSGLIWFTSEENKGTTFYVAIPITGMEIKTK